MTTTQALQARLAYELEQTAIFHRALLNGRYDSMSAAALRAMIRIRVGALCDARVALQSAMVGEQAAA